MRKKEGIKKIIHEEDDETKMGYNIKRQQRERSKEEKRKEEMKRENNSMEGKRCNGTKNKRKINKQVKK